ncbi:MAG: transaldolase [Parcubacteria group bacterium]|nr:transaldolase [Parcubacteria group bacterium]
MILFIDTADLEEIKRWLAAGVGDGVTTNPTLLKKAGFTEPVPAWKQIIGLIQKYSGGSLPLSVEVFRDDPEGMVEQATEFVSALGYAGTTVKIPIQALDGSDRLRVIKVLSGGGIAVNCTACMHWFQAFAAAKAGAKFVSLLYCRSNDAGLDGLDMISRTRRLIDLHGLKAQIIVGSIREAEQVFRVYDAGAHIITVPPKFFPQLLHQDKSVETQKQFLTDAGVVKA